MSFVPAFEKELNKHLQQEQEQDQDSKLYPPPLDLEAQDSSPPLPPPPPHTFPSYPEQHYQRNRGGGMYIPTPIFILFLLVLIFESCILFVYTVVALYNTLPGPMHFGTEMHQQPMMFAPNLMVCDFL
jgi:hypothetical protein